MELINTTLVLMELKNDEQNSRGLRVMIYYMPYSTVSIRVLHFASKASCCGGC
jgi:hypothetical protein